MYYLMMPLDQHFDLGFGAVANSFKNAGDLVFAPEADSIFLNHHLPASFLYRHAIELYLKSAIVIFHRKFRLPFGPSPFDGEAQVRVGGKWKQMRNVHALGELYSYFRSLFNDHATYLEANTNTDWSFPPELDKWVSEIEAMDSSSTFFRYPMTKHRDSDKAKSVMKEETPLGVLERMAPGDKRETGVKALFVLDENDEITRAFHHEDEGAQAILDILKRISEFLYGCHAAMRRELTGGR
jgi:hypothetical protein